MHVFTEPFRYIHIEANTWHIHIKIDSYSTVVSHDPIRPEIEHANPLKLLDVKLEFLFPIILGIYLPIFLDQAPVVSVFGARV